MKCPLLSDLFWHREVHLWQALRSEAADPVVAGFAVAAAAAVESAVASLAFDTYPAAPG